MQIDALMRCNVVSEIYTASYDQFCHEDETKEKEKLEYSHSRYKGYKAKC
jgi:hypothetical protein